MIKLTPDGIRRADEAQNTHPRGPLNLEAREAAYQVIAEEVAAQAWQQGFNAVITNAWVDWAGTKWPTNPYTRQ